MSRPRNPESIAFRLEAELLRRWQEHKDAGQLPTSGRFLYYEIKQYSPELIHIKHANGDSIKRPDGPVIAALTKLREQGLIPWADIVDETRNLDDFTGYASIREGIDAMLKHIRICPWVGKIPVVITESKSLAGVLRIHASDYRIRIAPTSGQTNGFLRTKVAPYLSPGDKVLYFGDWNKAGTQIEDNTRKILEEELGYLDWERLALTDEQVEEYNLPIKEVVDGRNGKAEESVETEALSQGIITQMLCDALDALLDEPLSIWKKRERQQREEIIRKLRQ